MTIPAEKASRIQGGTFPDERRRFEMHMASLRYAPQTILGYRNSLRVLEEYLGALGISQAREATPEVLEGFAFYLSTAESVEGKPYSPLTITGILTAARKFFEWQVASRKVLVDPTIRIKNPKAPKTVPREIPTEEEVARLLAAPDITTSSGLRDRAIMETIYATGMRSAEAAGLDVEDVDLSAGRILIRQGKPKKDRQVVLVPEAVATLRAYITQARPSLVKDPAEPALFLTYLGERIRRSVPSSVVMRYAEGLGLEKSVTPMALRHAVATHLLAAGVKIRELQVFLGHKSVETTTIYAKATPVDLQEHLRRFHPRQKERRRPREEPSPRAGAWRRLDDLGPSP